VHHKKWLARWLSPQPEKKVFKQENMKLLMTSLVFKEDETTAFL
jgi:hypothetical protein